ncbi:MAG: hypothetical protein QXG39_09385 [Candidatus Aenigmatarchaeota archaeon]
MYLIGAFHSDLKGEERLKKLLNYLKPKSIGLEWSVKTGSPAPTNSELKEDLELINQQISEYKQLASSFPHNLKKYFSRIVDAYCYEFRTVVSYQPFIGYEIYCIDKPGVRNIGKEFIKEITNLSQFIEIQKFSELPYENLLEEFQKICDLCYQDINSVLISYNLEDIEWEFYLPSFFEEREEYMARKVEELMPNVCVVGLLHTFLYDELSSELKRLVAKLMSKKTLADRISHLKPKLLKLSCADSLS